MQNICTIMTTLEQIEELRHKLNEYNRLYYVDNNPVVSDKEFDEMMYKLQELEKEHPEFFDPNSPTQRVGSDLTNRFEAVRPHDGGFLIDDHCEGCGVCVKLCPQQAIDFPDNHCGDWYVSDSRFGLMVHAQLFPGQENSGRLVSLLKAQARERARALGLETILCDGSPGVGCPVISSLSGASLAVGVVEPTPSGRHDFSRVADLCRHFRIPLAIIINKADLNVNEADAIAAECAEHGHTLLGRLPFDPVVTRAMVQRRALTEFDNPLGNSLKDMWSALQDMRTGR